MPQSIEWRRNHSYHFKTSALSIVTC